MTVWQSSWADMNDDLVPIRAAISDIGPPPFRNRIDQRLGDSMMAAGLLTGLTAQALDRNAQPAELERRAVGVQLIYEGLNITRALVRSPPWQDGRKSAADLKVLIAEVLIARGFSLLARTEASSVAIDVIRAFARDETIRRTRHGDSDYPDRTLEAAVFELAIVAGITATGATRPPGTRAFAVELAESMDDLDTDAFRFAESVVEDLDELIVEPD